MIKCRLKTIFYDFSVQNKNFDSGTVEKAWLKHSWNIDHHFPYPDYLFGFSPIIYFYVFHVTKFCQLEKWSDRKVVSQ